MIGNPVLPGEEMDVTTLSISSLAHLCQKATDSFFQRTSFDDSYCLELFRRAIELQNELAWEILVQQYTGLVISWIHRHPYFSNADEEHEYFVNRTFDNFWQAFNRDPEKLHKFNNVKSLLQYLKLCTNSAVKEYVERQMRPSSMDLSTVPLSSITNPNDPIANLEDSISANSVWRYILTVVKTEQERIVAEDYLIYDLKPREIYARHKDEFTAVSEVSRVKDNFMARLKRDKDLAQIFSGHG